MAKPVSDVASTPVTSPVRERIIEASADLFRQNGYDVSMDAIAQAAGVSKQSLYNHFGSKEELFKSIVTIRATAMRAPLTASGPDREPREVLLDVARQYYTLAFVPASIGFLRTIVSASLRFPEIGSDFYEVGPKQTLEVLVEWMEREERLGRLDTRNPRLAAEHFMSLLLGHIQTRGLLGLEMGVSEAELEERATFCADAFMRAFGGLVNRA